MMLRTYLPLASEVSVFICRLIDWCEQSVTNCLLNYFDGHKKFCSPPHTHTHTHTSVSVCVCWHFVIVDCGPGKNCLRFLSF